MKSFQVIVMLLATLRGLARTQETTEDNEINNCGQYGFECLDEKSLKFCPITVDDITDVTKIYECEEEYFCDEDNPAYCTPKEAPSKIVQEKNKADHRSDSSSVNEDAFDDVYFDVESDSKQVRVARESKGDDYVYEATEAPAESTTTESDEDDENAFATIEFTEAPPFDCDSYGYFPDPNNASLFWYCDVPLNGHGYLLRHMMCGHGRYFDKTYKNCLLNTMFHQEQKTIETRTTPTRTISSMDCSTKKPGKYPDESNCRMYHLCLSKKFSPAIQLTFMCHQGTAYDSLRQSCTTAAFKKSKTKLPSPNNINCTSPTRFRSLASCHSYFMCFIDNVIEIQCPKFYKFDDMAMECLPEKVADCKEHSA